MTPDELDTPALLAKLDVMEANLERMAAFFRGARAKLRPHFKHHKCPDLAWRQLDSGAIGITCATLREAECLVHHGARGVLPANDIVDTAKIRRFVELARRADVIVCIDEKIAGDIAREARNRHTEVNVLVDVDTGLHRCGVRPGERIVTDSGRKALSCERGIPAVKGVPGLKTRRLTAEHGIIDITDPTTPVAVGDRIEMCVHYSDATVNLHDRVYGVRGAKVEHVFRVEG
jgi:D-serine deaminase-like pyridoxal phosphate-dependent protein